MCLINCIVPDLNSVLHQQVVVMMKCHLPGPAKKRDTECWDTLGTEVQILPARETTVLRDEQNHFLRGYTHAPSLALSLQELPQHSFPLLNYFKLVCLYDSQSQSFRIMKLKWWPQGHRDTH